MDVEVKASAVVGLDTSSKSWHAAIYIPGSGFSEETPGDVKGSADERRLWLYRSALDLFGSLPPGAHVFIEEPLALPRNGKTTRLLGLAAGAIWAAHIDFDLWVYWVDVATWKKAIMGKGNAKKEEVAAYFNDLPTPVVCEVQDFYDARALAIYGIRALASMGTDRPSVAPGAKL